MPRRKYDCAKKTIKEAKPGDRVRGGWIHTIRDIDDHDTARTPEQRLLYAMVERTVRDLSPSVSGADYNKPALIREAKKWILSKDESRFSFIWTTQMLSFSDSTIEYLRNVARNPTAYTFPNTQYLAA
jgi:hypothetical protein